MTNFAVLHLVLSFVFLKVLTINVNGENSLVPALYVFGDSGTDVGNNNYVNTTAQQKDWPSGIDLNNQTGRFTNGKTIADFIAIMLGLPMAPAYLSLNETTRSQKTTGINYSSGGCGILKDTGPEGCLTFDDQIKYFTSTVKINLPKMIKIKKELSFHLAKSIFIVIIGENDLNVVFGRTLHEKFKKNYTIFVPFLLSQLLPRIKALYNLGARKFLVMDLYVGCNLPRKLKEMEAQLPNSAFGIYSTKKINEDVQTNPAKYGFTNIKDPCFEVKDKKKLLCHNRKEYLYWDKWGHVTEAGHEIAAKDCFNGTYGKSTCTPTIKEININNGLCVPDCQIKIGDY